MSTQVPSPINSHTGATTLLKLVAGRLAPTAGAVTYNGAAVESLAKGGAFVRKLAAFGAATDEHEALLTVREVVTFAHAAAIARAPEPST